MKKVNKMYALTASMLAIALLSNPALTWANKDIVEGNAPVIPNINCDSRVEGTECSKTEIKVEGNTTKVETENKTETVTTTSTGSTVKTEETTVVTTETTKETETKTEVVETETTKIKDIYVVETKTEEANKTSGMKKYSKVLPKTGASN